MCSIWAFGHLPSRSHVKVMDVGGFESSVKWFMGHPVEDSTTVPEESEVVGSFKH